VRVGQQNLIRYHRVTTHPVVIAELDHNNHALFEEDRSGLYRVLAFVPMTGRACDRFCTGCARFLARCVVFTAIYSKTVSVAAGSLRCFQVRCSPLCHPSISLCHGALYAPVIASRVLYRSVYGYASCRHTHRRRSRMPRKPQVSVEPRPDGRWAAQTSGTRRADSLHARNSDPTARGRKLAMGQARAGSKIDEQQCRWISADGADT
jgi:hypothetical protein